MNYNSKSEGNSLKIYIDNIPHLIIKVKDLIGIQSWTLSRDNLYYIEFYFKDGSDFYSEYDDIERWKEILRILDDKIELYE